MNADVLKLLGSAVGRAQLAQPNAGAPRSSGTPPELARSLTAESVRELVSNRQLNLNLAT